MFNRLVKLEILGASPFEITELRVSFRVEKSLVNYPQLAEITVYNLDETHRNQIEEAGLPFRLSAGHEDTGIALLFSGEVKNVVHEYIKPDWQTKIFSKNGDRAINESTINKTLPAGQTAEQIAKELVKTMDGVVLGIKTGLSSLSNDDESLLHSGLRATTLSGAVKNAWDKLSKKFNFDFSIDENVIDIVPNGKPANDDPPIIINQAAGMIDAPERTEIGVNVKTLLRPQARLSRRFKIEATSQKINIGNLFFRKIPPIKNEGIYRIDKLIHVGDTHANPWFTHFFGRNF